MQSNTNAVPEKTDLNIGYIPLTDCAPLAIAKEKGFFSAEGLTVKLSRESSWANIRDKVSAGVFDAGHMLAPMPIAAALNLDGLHTPMLTALSLSLGGNAITVSKKLYEKLAEFGQDLSRPLASVSALKQLLAQHQAEKRPPLTLAHVFPFSCHNYLMRYWLASAGIDPDKDVRLVVIPPPLMVNALAAGQIDGFCVGEPWNTQAIANGIGVAVSTGVDIWQGCPEKVLGVTQAWAQHYPNTHQALLRALLNGAVWLENMQNRAEASAILTGHGYVPVEPALLKTFECGEFQFCGTGPVVPVPDFCVFYRHAATFPWVSHADWLIGQMQRWGQIPAGHAVGAVSAQVYRPDLYRQAAHDLGLPYPLADRKTEGSHAQRWWAETESEPISMGGDCFFDQIMPA
ncbi:MAG: CmpA/NrtA family ABC transporter substrate-binding protein [Methylovulum sp.]|nr:CmpA/NrtA family ABC transporter substrate-binding protein [Methylovulum sp.]